MTLKKGKCVISIERVEGFGKNPGLWVGTERGTTKVASFKDEASAAKFCTYLKYFLSDLMEPNKGGAPDDQTAV